MAAPINTLVTTDVAGNREDLTNEIERIVPMKTPFYSNIGKAKMSATFHEHQVDDLAAVDTDNSHVEGDDTTLLETETPDRVGCIAQIMKKSYVVSGTQQAVSTAGIEDDLDFAKMKKLAELKRDTEYVLLSGQAGVNPATGTAKRKMGGVFSWIETNVSFGAGGAAGGYADGTTSAPTAGTARAFTEDLLKDVMQQRFNTTGDVGDSLQAYMSAAHKETFGSFAGLSETRDSVAGKRGKRVIYGAADVYVSHFGNITAIPHAYAELSDRVLIADPAMWKKATLRKVEDGPLAKTGDADKRQIIKEVSLKSCNEKASAAIFDLN